MKHETKNTISRKMMAALCGIFMLSLLLSIPAAAQTRNMGKVYTDTTAKEYVYKSNGKKKTIKGGYRVGDDYFQVHDFKNVTISDPSMADVLLYTLDGVKTADGTGYTLILKLKKEGKLKVTFTALQGGAEEWHDYKITIIAGKYVNPFKTLKIGTKSYVTAFNKANAEENASPVGNYYSYSAKAIANTTVYKKIKKALSGKLTVSVKKGWQIKKIYYKASDTAKAKAIKNKASLKFADAEGAITFVVKNTVKGYYEIFTLAGSTPEWMVG